MEEKLKYGSVMMMLVSAKSTWSQKHNRSRRGEGIRLDCVCRSISRRANLKHLLSKQMVPHFPLDVPVDQITLQRNDRDRDSLSVWEADRPAAASQRDSALTFWKGRM